MKSFLDIHLDIPDVVKETGCTKAEAKEALIASDGSVFEAVNLLNHDKNLTLALKGAKFLNGEAVPKDRILKVLKDGPRSPAFYMSIETWKEDKHIYEQLKGTPAQQEAERQGMPHVP